MEELLKLKEVILRLKDNISSPILDSNDLIIGERNAYFRILEYINKTENDLRLKRVDKIVKECIKYA